jgi:hypothetical protein
MSLPTAFSLRNAGIPFPLPADNLVSSHALALIQRLLRSVGVVKVPPTRQTDLTLLQTCICSRLNALDVVLPEIDFESSTVAAGRLP